MAHAALTHARARPDLRAEAGIRQIIDIGAGLPTAGNTHEVALEACPQARVVYVDHDPIVLAHARSMLHGVPGTAVIGRDMLEPDSILADRSLRELTPAVPDQRPHHLTSARTT
jgi:hypothetical protein